MLIDDGYKFYFFDNFKKIFFLRTMGNDSKKKKLTEAFYIDLKTNEITKYANEALQKALKKQYPIVQREVPEYVIIKQWNNKEKDYKYFNPNTGKLITAKDFTGDLKLIGNSSYRTFYYDYRIERVQLVDSLETYEATVVNGYNRKNGKLEKSIQLTQSLAEIQKYADGSANRLTAAKNRREERRLNAIATAAGKEKFKYENEVLKYVRYDPRGKSSLNWALGSSENVSMQLTEYFNVGDLLFFPKIVAQAEITAIDHKNNIIQINKPGETVEEQNAVHYLPMNETRCYKKRVTVNVAGTTSCSICHGLKKVKIGTREKSGGDKGDWQYSGYNKQGYKTVSRTVEQEDVMKTCHACNGTGLEGKTKTEYKEGFKCLIPTK